MESIASFLSTLSSIIWGPFLLIPLLLGTGIYLTIRLSGLQFHKLFPAMHLGLIRRKDDTAEGDIPQFQALTTALAATVGTGNIVGVAGALAVGGPGALFWMWMTGLLGMATKYSEGFLAVRFRRVDAKGERSGGPQYYLDHGIKHPIGKVLAIMFAIFAFIASFGIGNMTQGNSIAENVSGSFGIPTWITGLVLTVLTMLVLVGGIKSIGKITAALVPIMIIFYVLASIWILIANAGAIPSAFARIFTEAFTGTAAAGGFLGSSLIIAVQMGVARGLFSNESGLGSAPIAAAAAQTTHPVRQGLVSMTQTFIDTIIVVTCTGLVILSTGTWQNIDEATGEQVSSALMTAQAFSHGLPGSWGHLVVTIGIVLFAFSTILGWSYYGERNVERLFGHKLVMPFRILFSIVVFFGCTMQLEVVWNFSDVANGLMALPNLVGILILSGLISRETKWYLHHDPKLKANAQEVERFMQHRDEWDDWKRGEQTASHPTDTA